MIYFTTKCFIAFCLWCANKYSVCRNTKLARKKNYGSLNVDLNSTLGGFAGFRINEKYLLGYSYDTSITKFSNSNGGIHSFFPNICLEDYCKGTLWMLVCFKI